MNLNDNAIDCLFERLADFEDVTFDHAAEVYMRHMLDELTRILENREGINLRPHKSE